MVFAGLTVIIALAGLSVIGIPTATKMGLTAAATVAVSVLVAVTLIPALLGFFPRAVLPRAARRNARVARGSKPNVGSRWAGFVLHYQVASNVVATWDYNAYRLTEARLRILCANRTYCRHCRRSIRPVARLARHGVLSPGTRAESRRHGSLTAQPELYPGEFNRSRMLL